MCNYLPSNWFIVNNVAHFEVLFNSVNNISKRVIEDR